jgi:hypothetical protein
LTKPKRIAKVNCDLVIAKLRRELKYDVNLGVKFKNAEDEVDDVIKRTPELAACRGSLVKLCTEYRVKNNLLV